MKILESILFLIFVMCILSIGWLSNDIFRYYNLKRTIDGVYFQGEYTKFEATKEAYGLDKVGDWVCVNIKGMSYERAVHVCEHEVGHEIWAEICEKDNELCKRGQELLQDYSHE